MNSLEAKQFGKTARQERCAPRTRCTHEGLELFFRSWEGGRGGEGGWRKKCFRERGKEREACKTLLGVNMEIKEGERESERPTHPQNSRGIRPHSSRATDAISGRRRVDFVRLTRSAASLHRPPLQMHHGRSRGSSVELMREALSTHKRRSSARCKIKN